MATTSTCALTPLSAISDNGLWGHGGWLPVSSLGTGCLTPQHLCQSGVLYAGCSQRTPWHLCESLQDFKTLQDSRTNATAFAANNPHTAHHFDKDVVALDSLFQVLVHEKWKKVSRIHEAVARNVLNRLKDKPIVNVCEKCFSSGVRPRLNGRSPPKQRIKLFTCRRFSHFFGLPKVDKQSVRNALNHFSGACLRTLNAEVLLVVLVRLLNKLFNVENGLLMSAVTSDLRRHTS